MKTIIKRIVTIVALLQLHESIHAYQYTFVNKTGENIYVYTKNPEKYIFIESNQKAALDSTRYFLGKTITQSCFDASIGIGPSVPEYITIQGLPKCTPENYAQGITVIITQQNGRFAAHVEK